MWRIPSFFRALFTIFLLIVAAVVVIPFRWAGPYRRKMQTLVARGWNSNVFRWVGIDVEVEGRENDKLGVPSLIVSNHQSLLDIPAAYRALGGDIRMVAKKELAWVPFFGWGMWSSEFIFVKRDSPRSRLKAADLISDRLRSGIRIWIAPEGTRSKDGKLAAFRPRSFTMAIDAGAWIQPIVVMNARDFLPKNGWLVKPGGPLRIKILPAVSTQGLKVEEATRLMNQVHDDMKKALGQA